jgi:hypothetical protein
VVNLGTILNFAVHPPAPPDFPAASRNGDQSIEQIICTMNESAVWQETRKPSRRRRKCSLSQHQKQMRFFTVMVVLLVLVAFTGMICWFNL